MKAQSNQKFVWVEDNGEAFLKALIIREDASTVIVKDVKTGTALQLPKGKVHVHDVKYDKSNGDLSFVDPVSIPTVLDVLKSRYKLDMFFSRVSPLIISLHPNKTVDRIFDFENFEKLSEDEKLCHLYDITSNCMDDITHINQTILLLGNSGSGKTFTLQKIMAKLLRDCNLGIYRNIINERYYAMFGVLQSFGCAGTWQNTESSRFCNIYKLLLQVRYLSLFMYVFVNILISFYLYI